MRHKPQDPARPRDPADINADTSSIEQLQGSPDAGARPATRRSPRVPNERDESAEATGNRLNENPIPSDRKISQAGEDVKAGRMDTERRGIPNDVPKGS